MSQRPYLYRLFARARKMTGDDVGFVSPKQTTLHFLLAAITLFIIYKLTGTDVATEELNLWWASILGLIAWVGLIFILNLVLSPLSLQKEADNKIAKLEKVIYDREKRQKAIDKLWEFRSNGISIRNDMLKPDAIYIAWKPRFSSWRDELLSEAEKISPNLKQWLERLDLMRDKAVQISQHKDVQIMSEILARLGEFLEGEIYNVPRKIPKF